MFNTRRRFPQVNPTLFHPSKFRYNIKLGTFIFCNIQKIEQLERKKYEEVEPPKSNLGSGETGVSRLNYQVFKLKTGVFWKNFKKMLKNIKKAYYMRKIPKILVFRENLHLTISLNFFQTAWGLWSPPLKPSPRPYKVWLGLHVHSVEFLKVHCTFDLQFLLP